MERYYKAFDFKSGKTYLIGSHESKGQARAFCKAHGIYAIAQTVRSVPEREYFRLLHEAAREDE